MIRVTKDSRFRDISEAQVEDHKQMGWTVEDSEVKQVKKSKAKKADDKPVEAVEENIEFDIDSDADATE